VPRLRTLHLLARHFQLRTCTAQLGAGVFGALHPGVQVVRRGRRQRQPCHIHAGDLRHRLVHQQLQLPACQVQVLPHLQLLRIGQIQPRARLVDIGAGAGARGQRLGGGIHGGGEGLLLQAHHLELLACQQHIKVGHCHARHQVLRLALQLRFGIFHLKAGLAQLHLQFAAVDRLA
jgi:hypothetical protein